MSLAECCTVAFPLSPGPYLLLRRQRDARRPRGIGRQRNETMEFPLRHSWHLVLSDVSRLLWIPLESNLALQRHARRYRCCDWSSWNIQVLANCKQVDTTASVALLNTCKDRLGPLNLEIASWLTAFEVGCFHTQHLIMVRSDLVLGITREQYLHNSLAVQVFEDALLQGNVTDTFYLQQVEGCVFTFLL